jgi:hypothetical protein
MARIRTIKPEFWTSEQVIELSPIARLLFIGMWNFCDDRGVMPAAVKSLKAKVLPADDFRTEDIKGFVAEMIDQGLVEEFESNGSRWWSVTGWKHQVINRPSPSNFPEPPRLTPLPSVDGAATDDASLRGPLHSTASDAARMSPAHSPAAEVVSDADSEPKDSDSLSAHGGLTEDSALERKGEERKGEEKAERVRAPPQARSVGERAPSGARLTLSALPEDWRAWAEQERPDLDADRTWDLFADYWRAQPGRVGVKSDWLATWRNWVRRERPPPGPCKAPRSTLAERNRDAVELWLSESAATDGHVLEGDFCREA